MISLSEKRQTSIYCGYLSSAKMKHPIKTRIYLLATTVRDWGVPILTWFADEVRDWAIHDNEDLHYD